MYVCYLILLVFLPGDIGGSVTLIVGTAEAADGNDC